MNNRQLFRNWPLSNNAQCRLSRLKRTQRSTMTVYWQAQWPSPLMAWSGRAQCLIVGAEGLGSIELEGASDAISSEVECRRHRYRN